MVCKKHRWAHVSESADNDFNILWCAWCGCIKWNNRVSVPGTDKAKRDWLGEEVV